MSLAIVFPGQGSQSIGMMNDLVEAFPLVRELYQEAADTLDIDLWEIVCNGPEDELNNTAITQPALLTAGVATWKIWIDNGGEQPAMLAGHSLGEYTALVCAEVLEFSEAVALVRDRGNYMQHAVPAGAGAMAAILGLDDKKVTAVCEQISGDKIVSAANFNSPGQVVIAGHSDAVQQAITAAKQAGAKRAVLLPISVPSHCALMQDAADKLAQRLQGVRFAQATIPVLQNADVMIHTDSDEIKQALIRQLHLPVRWTDTITRMKTSGIKRIIECGPGKVLTGLNKRIERDLDALAIFDTASFNSALEVKAA